MSNTPFYTDNFPSGLRIAQIAGLTTSAFLAGKTFSQSVTTTPALLESPAPLLAKQWKKIFDGEKYLAPAVTLFSSGVFGLIAYREDHWTKTSILWTSSASLLFALVPYNLLLGGPIAQKLESKAQSLASASVTDAAAEAGITKEETTHYLVDKLAAVNFGSFVISTVAAVLATWAAVARTDIVPASVRLSTGANRLGN